MHLERLEVLDISKNEIECFPDDFGSLMNLRVLSVARNRIETLPIYIASMESLRVLKLDHNPIEWPPEHIIRYLAEENDFMWLQTLKKFLSDEQSRVKAKKEPEKTHYLDLSPTRLGSQAAIDAFLTDHDIMAEILEHGLTLYYSILSCSSSVLHCVQSMQKASSYKPSIHSVDRDILSLQQGSLELAVLLKASLDTAPSEQDITNIALVSKELISRCRWTVHCVSTTLIPLLKQRNCKNSQMVCALVLEWVNVCMLVQTTLNQVKLGPLVNDYSLEEYVAPYTIDKTLPRAPIEEEQIRTVPTTLDVMHVPEPILSTVNDAHIAQDSIDQLLNQTHLVKIYAIKGAFESFKTGFLNLHLEQNPMNYSDTLSKVQAMVSEVTDQIETLSDPETCNNFDMVERDTKARCVELGKAIKQLFQDGFLVLDDLQSISPLILSLLQSFSKG